MLPFYFFESFKNVFRSNSHAMKNNFTALAESKIFASLCNRPISKLKTAKANHANVAAFLVLNPRKLSLILLLSFITLWAQATTYYLTTAGQATASNAANW